jgi:hypothetical protein
VALLIVVACAVLFFRMAHYEGLSWVWGFGSAALSFFLLQYGFGMGWLLAAQAGLFVALWFRLAQKRMPG